MAYRIYTNISIFSLPELFTHFFISFASSFPLSRRGINAGEISGPGYCLHPPPKRRIFNDTAGCKGGNCSRSHNFVEIEDIQVHLSQRGGSLTDCGKVKTVWLGPGKMNGCTAVVRSYCSDMQRQNGTQICSFF